MGSVLIVGCGDIGQRVAQRYRADGVSVTGVVRSEASAARLRRLGIKPAPADLDRALPSGTLPTRGKIVHYHAPPPREGQNDRRMQHFLDSIPASARPRRIVYLSTSSVYGDCEGEWVTEDREPDPASDRGRRRLAAEQLLGGWCAERGVECVTLRVPGIYGPGRLPIKRLQSGTPVVDEQECPYSNRIHGEDLTSASLAAAERGVDGGVYNVSDGTPTTMTDYFMQVADALGLDPPPVVSMDEARETLTPAMLSFLSESKRLDNTRMREQLGVTLQYPDLDKGLAASVRDDPELRVRVSG